jgi:hypothetical protein
MLVLCDLAVNAPAVTIVTESGYASPLRMGHIETPSAHTVATHNEPAIRAAAPPNQARNPGPHQ